MFVQNTKQNTITMIAETFRKNIKRRCVYDTVSKNPNQKIIKRKLLGYLKINYLIIQSNDTLPILKLIFFIKILINFFLIWRIAKFLVYFSLRFVLLKIYGKS